MAAELTTLDLVKHYINICNAALATPDANPLVSLVESVMTKAVSGETIHLEVVDDSGDTLGHYTTRFVDGRFTPVEEGPPEEEGEDAPKRFTLSRSFLAKVVEDSDHYLAHPEDLDWSWLTGG